jgi:hypothetical protein
MARISAPTADIDFLIRPSQANATALIGTPKEFGFAGSGFAAEDFVQANQIVQLGVKPNRIDLITSISGVEFDEAANHATTTSSGAWGSKDLRNPPE